MNNSIIEELNTEKAKFNENSHLDFTKIKDKEFLSNYDIIKNEVVRLREKIKLEKNLAVLTTVYFYIAEYLNLLSLHYPTYFMKKKIDSAFLQNDNIYNQIKDDITITFKVDEQSTAHDKQIGFCRNALAYYELSLYSSYQYQQRNGYDHLISEDFEVRIRLGYARSLMRISPIYSLLLIDNLERTKKRFDFYNHCLKDVISLESFVALKSQKKLYKRQILKFLSDYSLAHAKDLIYTIKKELLKTYDQRYHYNEIIETVRTDFLPVFELIGKKVDLATFENIKPGDVETSPSLPKNSLSSALLNELSVNMDFYAYQDITQELILNHNIDLSNKTNLEASILAKFSYTYLDKISNLIYLTYTNKTEESPVGLDYLQKEIFNKNSDYTNSEALNRFFQLFTKQNNKFLLKYLNQATEIQKRLESAFYSPTEFDREIKEYCDTLALAYYLTFIFANC